MPTIYTNCPPSYDGFGTRTVALIGKTSRGYLRQVETEEPHHAWQLGRYHSGGVYITTDKPDLVEYFRKLGDVTEGPFTCSPATDRDEARLIEPRQRWASSCGNVFTVETISDPGPHAVVTVYCTPPRLGQVRDVYHFHPACFAALELQEELATEAA